MGERLEIAKFSLRACRCPRLTSYVVRCHRSCGDGASWHSSTAVCGSRGFAARPWLDQEPGSSSSVRGLHPWPTGYVANTFL